MSAKDSVINGEINGGYETQRPNENGTRITTEAIFAWFSVKTEREELHSPLSSYHSFGVLWLTQHLQTSCCTY